MSSTEHEEGRSSSNGGPFQFDEKTLTEYPWLRDVALTDSEKASVSAVIVNNRNAQEFIPDISTGRPTANLEYLSKVAAKALKNVRLFADKVPQLRDLIEKESRLLQENITATRKAIGGVMGFFGKKRDKDNGGKYK